MAEQLTSFLVKEGSLEGGTKLGLTASGFFGFRPLFLGASILHEQHTFRATINDIFRIVGSGIIAE